MSEEKKAQEKLEEIMRIIYNLRYTNIYDYSTLDYVLNLIENIYRR